MNSMKYIFYTIVLTASYNAFGMMGFGHELTNQKPSKQLQLEVLGLLHLDQENQNKYFDYLNKGDINNQEFQNLTKKAENNRFNNAHPQHQNVARKYNTNTQNLVKVDKENIPTKQFGIILITKNSFTPTRVLAPRNK